ncbi:hypothetical protein PV04_05863 [Phialophora macrospora]|uniref:Xylanolytic transcriptional activator regulatory domain-containing protein n=1 Tax=Phialophora macrospora TaxID=1851006 RepID=A0A0D2G3A7_9EURO|nr:hypothetical protein PV04_05863 [Phialophora macrospora]
MLLITHVSHDSRGEHMDESLYRKVKRMILLSELECEPSLDLVQARFLLASYKMGHGLESAAFLSIGACARLAIVLGLDQGTQPDNGAARTVLEERSRIWWGIVIVERCINLTFPERPLITPDPEVTDYLPVEDDGLDNGSVQYSTPIPMTAASSVRAGPFAREAQAASLLGRSLTHIAKPTPDPEFNLEESRQLERTLTSFLNVLPREDLIKPCSAYCGAMGMCTSALLLLHTRDGTQRRQAQEEEDSAYSKDALNSCCGFVVERAAEYTSELATVDLDSLPPFTPYAIYQASVVQHRFLEQGGTNDGKSIRHGLDLMGKMLASFALRWGVAGKLYRLLR